MASLSRPFALLALCAIMLGCFAHECEAASVCHGAPAIVRAPSAPHTIGSELRVPVSTGAVAVASIHPPQPSTRQNFEPVVVEHDGFRPAAQGRAPPAFPSFVH